MLSISFHILPPPFSHISKTLHHSTKNAFERSLVRLHKMPSLWLHYATLIALYNPECDVTLVRHVYDRALIALPASQHDRIWEDYICWVTVTLPGKTNLESSRGQNAFVYHHDLEDRNCQ